MPSYFISGTSRGLGYEFLRQISSAPENVVIGLVRNKAATLQKIAEDRDLDGRTNIHIVEADVTDYSALKVAVEETTRITSGQLDYVIANHGLISTFSAYEGLFELGEGQPLELEQDLKDCFNINVIGTIHLFNLLLPLVLAGPTKKVIALSTGLTDEDLCLKYKFSIAGPYVISKAGLNHAISKYNGEFADKGVLFMGISPGLIDNGQFANLTEKQQMVGQKQGAQFATEYPHWKGPISNEESVQHVMKVIKESSVEGGNGGTYVSHFGDKQWL